MKSLFPEVHKQNVYYVQCYSTLAELKVESDRQIINADGKDVAFLKISIVDDQGTLVPFADNQVSFEVAGSGRLLGVGNGNPNSRESDLAKTHRAFSGLLLALVQSSSEPGKVSVIVKADGLRGNQLVIDVR